jgi:hypothetical protein
MPKTSPMRLIKEPQPLHHVSVVRRFQDMHASFTARVLLLRRSDGVVEPYLPLIRYQRALRYRSRSWQDNAARALGLFWDFGVAHAGEGWGPRDLFREFAYALLEGTIDSSRPASRSLMWPSVPRERAQGLVRGIEGFAEWCSTQDDIVSPIAPEEIPLIPGTGEQATRLLMWGRLRRVSMLQHIKKPPSTSKKSFADLGRSSGRTELRRAKHFPAEFAEKLLWEGHKRPGAETDPNIFLRHNVRDIMVALLDGWGGLRRSEGLHLWIHDVAEDPESPGHALVVLNHPEEARVQWSDPLSNALRTTTRKEMLARAYGLRARNVVKRGSYHVGWKGMSLNEDYQACIFWIDAAAGALFWTLYLGYIRYVRPTVMKRRIAMGGRDHPFLFVSEEVNTVTGLPGEPYSEQAYERNHKAAVLRIDLPHSKASGTTTHGLRHLYGQTMQDLGVPPQVIRQGLHHTNLLSQMVYTVPPVETVNRVLRQAQEKLTNGLPPVAPLSNDTSAALLRLRQFLSHGSFK